MLHDPLWLISVQSLTAFKHGNKSRYLTRARLRFSRDTDAYNTA
jgi:hypothetical protein